MVQPFGPPAGRSAPRTALLLTTIGCGFAALSASGALASGGDQAEETPARLSLQAQWTDRAPVLDGRLDEAEWAGAETASGFVQSKPYEGGPVSERTVVRVLFDRDNLYIGAHCLDSEPGRILINELSRDFNSWEGDAFGVSPTTRTSRRWRWTSSRST
jgi:hypothetical protein